MEKNLENKDRGPAPFFEITEKVIGSSFEVMNHLGCGFLEKVYENALLVELRNAGLKAVQQFPIRVDYKGASIGEFMADLLVEDNVLVELKVAQGLEDVHYAQCLNYLKATSFGVCLLINFGRPELQVRRISPRKEWVKNGF